MDGQGQSPLCTKPWAVRRGGAAPRSLSVSSPVFPHPSAKWKGKSGIFSCFLIPSCSLTAGREGISLHFPALASSKGCPGGTHPVRVSPTHDRNAAEPRIAAVPIPPAPVLGTSPQSPPTSLPAAPLAQPGVRHCKPPFPSFLAWLQFVTRPQFPAWEAEVLGRVL